MRLVYENLVDFCFFPRDYAVKQNIVCTQAKQFFGIKRSFNRQPEK